MDLVVYGGNGKAARDHASLQANATMKNPVDAASKPPNATIREPFHASAT